MVNARERLKIDIMRALSSRPMTLFEVSPLIVDENVMASHIAKALAELVDEGYLVIDDSSSTVGTVYRHATESSLSDLRTKLLPHDDSMRDPVREAHEHEATQGRPARYRRVSAQGADLGDDD